MYLPVLGFSFESKFFPKKNAMTIPAISNNINTTIGTITPTSTTVDIQVQPPSDVIPAVILGTPSACDDVCLCSIEVDGDSTSDVVLALILGTPFACDDVYLCSIEVDGGSSDVSTIANGI